MREAAHDDLAIPLGRERGVAARVADDLRAFVDVEEAVGERDPRVAERADALDDVGAAVVVGVAQRDERRGCGTSCRGGRLRR